jgi:hypothetical protein
MHSWWKLVLFAVAVTLFWILPDKLIVKLLATVGLTVGVWQVLKIHFDDFGKML